MRKTLIEAARELSDPKTEALVDRLTSAELELFGVPFGEMMAGIPWKECNQPTHAWEPSEPGGFRWWIEPESAQCNGEREAGRLTMADLDSAIRSIGPPTHFYLMDDHPLADELRERAAAGLPVTAEWFFDRMRERMGIAKMLGAAAKSVSQQPPS